MAVMKTYDERLARMREIVSDPDHNLTLTEVATHVYHWWRYEMLILKREKITRTLHKHGRALNEDMKAFEFRKELNKL